MTHPHCEPPAHRRRRFERFPLAFYLRARLHRTLFAYFGVTIAAAGGLAFAALVFGRDHGGPRLLLPLLVALIVLWGASGKLARRLARPLADVARVAREIGRGNLESRARLDRHTPGEVGVLAIAINDMAVRIESQIRDQRVLLAAVSHELRTPLGHARILVELLRNKGADARTLDDLERELVELDTLVGELLASSRLDFSILNPRPIDAVDLARFALDRAGVPRDRLEASPADARFTGDPTLLGRALANLLDNAAKHGGGVVALRVVVEDLRVRFEVDDAGPGIPEARLQDLFAPFYRRRGEGDADAGATGERSENGTLGLGLSLVNRIAEAHQGHAFARARPEGRGARVGFEVPRSPPPEREPKQETEIKG